jgi:RHS repeat-associated protein
VQKTWVNTYDPDLKFSGKEREGYSGLDYFGARYYDHKSYRFNSVDPIINKGDALVNPQFWNLYAYCRNNPVTFNDPNGKDVILLNSPNLFYGDGHNSILIGRDKGSDGSGGWVYKSKDGVKSRISGSDINTTKNFDSLNEFEKSEIAKSYERKFRMKTDEETDNRMLEAADVLIKIEYQVFKTQDKKGKVTGMNCADFTGAVLTIGGKRVPQSKGYASPDLQYDFVKKYNKGEELK